MAQIRLNNDDWGIETNCFACEPRNERGLQIDFFHDTDRDVVTAEFELSDTFSGAPTLVHGGVVLTVLDEAMAWACIAVGKQWAMTTEMSTRFERPVRVGRRYRVEASIVSTADDEAQQRLRTTATIVDERCVTRAEASAVFTTLGEAQLVRLTGVEAPDEHRGYLRDG